MKKIIIVFFLLLNVLIVEKVNAQTYNLILDRQEGIYYSRSGGDLPYYASQFIIYRLGNEIAYCIEPSKNITTYNYVDSGGYINLPYSDEVKRKIQLIGYFGREYPGHNNVRYSMAAQSLIWNITSNQEITFWTGPNETGSIIDVTKEKDEIINLVNNYQYLNIPRNIDSKYNEVFEFTDNLLKEYEISNYGSFNEENSKIILKNNKLRISSKNIGESFIELKRKTYDEKETLFFIGGNLGNSQTLGRLRVPDDPVRISINTKGIKIKIYKYDEKNNRILLDGIKFKIKNLDTNTYLCENNDCLFETKDGIVTTKELDFGNYEIEEIDQIIKGYTVNEEKQRVEIQRNKRLYYTEMDDHFVMVNFINHKITGELFLEKEIEDFEVVDEELVYNIKDGNNITFDLYNEEGEYIDSLTTNDEGKAFYENLEIGKYYLVEHVPHNIINNNNKYFFEIQQTNSKDRIIEVYLNIKNYLQKGNIKINKMDKDTFIGIPNTTFDIYYEDNFLFSKKTDELGEITLSNMPVGNYYLQEKEANEMYRLTNEKVMFEVTENNLSNIEIFNELKKVEVPETLDNINNYINLLGFISLLGWCIYVKES